MPLMQSGNDALSGGVGNHKSLVVIDQKLVAASTNDGQVSVGLGPVLQLRRKLCLLDGVDESIILVIFLVNQAFELWMNAGCVCEDIEHHSCIFFHFFLVVVQHGLVICGRVAKPWISGKRVSHGVLLAWLPHDDHVVVEQPFSVPQYARVWHVSQGLLP